MNEQAEQGGSKVGCIIAAILGVLLLCGGVIGAVVLVGYKAVGQAKSQAERAHTMSMLSQIEMGIEAYHMDTGYYPGSGFDGADDIGMAEALHRGLRGAPSQAGGGGMNGPYVDLMDEGPSPGGGEVFLDVWGNPIHYREWASRTGEKPGARRPERFDLWSAGPDGIDDGGDGDDIGNWF